MSDSIPPPPVFNGIDPILLWQMPSLGNAVNPVFCPEDSELVKALIFYQWRRPIPSMGIMPSPPGLGFVWVEEWVLMRDFIPILCPRMGCFVFSQRNAIDLRLTEACWSRVFTALRNAGMFRHQLKDEIECRAALLEATPLVQWAPGLLSPFSLTALDVLPPAYDFGPATFSVVPHADVPGLRVLALASVTDFVRVDDALPLEAFGFLNGLLGPVQCPSLWRNETSEMRLGAAAIYSALPRRHTLATEGVSYQAGAAALPDHLLRVRREFPDCYAMCGLSPVEASRYFHMQSIFCAGSRTVQMGLERDLILATSRVAPQLHAILLLAGSPTAAYITARQLVTILFPQRVHLPLHTLLEDLEGVIVSQLAVLGPSRLSLQTVFATITAGLDGQTGNAEGPAGSSFKLMGARRIRLDRIAAAHPLSVVELRAAIEHPDFQETVVAVEGICCDTRKGRLIFLMTAVRCRAVIMRRYLVFRELAVENSHVLFGRVKGLLLLLPYVLGAAAAADSSTGRVPGHLENFTWGAVEEIRRAKAELEGRTPESASESSADLFWTGEYARANMVDAPGGFEILNLVSVCPIKNMLGTSYAFCGSDRNLHYCEVRSLVGIRDFMSPIFAATGHAQYSSDGLTFYEALGHYILFARRGEALSGDARMAHFEWANRCMAKTLAQAQTLYRDIVLGPHPAGRRLDCFVPFSDEGIAALSERTSYSERASIMLGGMFPRTESPPQGQPAVAADDSALGGRPGPAADEGCPSVEGGEC